MFKVLLKVINYFQYGRILYKSEWVEDLPDKPQKNTIYIIGGRDYPFYAAITCPRKRCKEIIHLDISQESTKGWTLKEYEDGILSINPSIHVTGKPCGCHYFIKKGCVIWCEIPPFFVPKENRTS